MSETMEKVKEIIKDHLNPEVDITENSKIIDDLKADSLDSVELMMKLEENFGITIPDEDVEKIVTVGDAVKYIEEQSNK